MGIRLMSLMLVLVCLFGLAQPVSATEATEVTEADSTLVTVVRYRASYYSASIGQMEDGTEVTVLGQTRDFYKIDCYDMIGYVAKSQIVHTEDGKSYVNCQEESSETQTLSYTALSETLVLRHSIFKLARKQLGYPYAYGGSRPGGFDCSGLMYYLYGQHDISLHRAASGQLQDGLIVAKENMQIGDLVFFREGGSSISSHVGIYVGDNQIIHAGNKGVGYADLDSAYFSAYFLCARRILNVAPSQIENVSTANMESTIYFPDMVGSIR